MVCWIYKLPKLEPHYEMRANVAVLAVVDGYILCPGVILLVKWPFIRSNTKLVPKDSVIPWSKEVTNSYVPFRNMRDGKAYVAAVFQLDDKGVLGERWPNTPDEPMSIDAPELPLELRESGSLMPK